MKISKELFTSLIISTPILICISFFNSYIFDDDNLIFLPFIISLFLLFKLKILLDPKLFLNLNTFLFLTFIMYIFLRYDITVECDNCSAQKDIYNLICYFFIFILGSLLSYNLNKFPLTIWILSSAYWLMLIVRNIISLEEIQSGYHGSTGIVILSIIPFILISPKKIQKIILTTSFFLILLFLTLIGARGAILSIFGLYIFVRYYRIFSFSKRIYSLTFFLLIFSILASYYFYLNFLGDINKPMLVQDSIFHALQKEVGTRFAIWMHNIEFISHKPFFGYGSHLSTSNQHPHSLESLPLLNRENISAHSTYLELLYRSGIIGLLIFILFMFKLYTSLYNYLHIYEIRVASGLIVAMLIGSISSNMMIFNNLELWAGFIWFYFGYALGIKRKLINNKIYKN